ncbi:glycosyltransferase [Candidatus Chloroploca mongolica]|nr:glycosyltransferase [Candidatus Chloroploca mongolica]
MMRILMIIPYVPSPIRVRSYQLLRHLAQRGHQITLICAEDGPDDEANLGTLRPLCTKIQVITIARQARIAAYLRAVISDLPLQAAHCLVPAFIEAIKAEFRSGEHDVVHIEHLRAAEIARVAAAQVPTRPPLILDAVDSISLLFERATRSSPSLRARAMALLDLARTKRYEATCGQHVDHIIITSPEDAWALQTLQTTQFQSAPITVVPNGVELDCIQPVSEERAPATIIFSGKMSYHANEAAAHFLLDTIMPLVWQQRPDAHVILAGANPGPALRAYARNPLVTVTGFVPDLRTYLARATVAVAPMRYGVGVQNKVLEAMATATPVVTTRQTTVALTARPDHELLVADHATQFAQAILKLLADPPYARTLGNAGRAYVEQAHNWAASAMLLETCYASVQHQKVTTP